ncbi:MAG: hypothetical protein DMG82_24305 [Acidobacteria bacterium]|nr:MAG: hypothetical protein DMG82_24305 [Acidobacteriota bacterium]PYX41757.1 MAG: hypothetical protein DMG83_23025 [Acidobacteriota bacterium]
MKRASRKLIRDSGETTDQSETAAQFLEDLAAHAVSDCSKEFPASSPKHSRKPQATEGESRTNPT